MLPLQALRKRVVLKVVPMLNPDGVIVGNYRCSLAARDLNRQYRHPRRDAFPTVWHTKDMMQRLAQDHEVSAGAWVGRGEAGRGWAWWGGWAVWGRVWWVRPKQVGAGQDRVGWVWWGRVGLAGQNRAVWCVACSVGKAHPVVGGVEKGGQLGLQGGAHLGEGWGRTGRVRAGWRRLGHSGVKCG